MKDMGNTLLAQQLGKRQKAAVRLIDYFRGRRISLRSPLSEAEITARINAATPSAFAIMPRGAIGGVSTGLIWVGFVPNPRRYYSGMPVLVGQLRDVRGSTRVEATYRAPLSYYIWWPLWYLVLAMISILLVSRGLNGQLEQDALPLAIVIPLFAAAPFVMHHYGARDVDDHLQAILRFLENEVQLVMCE